MIDKLIKRTSVRDFLPYEFTKEEIQKITDVINNAPTSVNHQQFGAVIITDQKLKDIIGTNNWNQEHIKRSSAFILFLADRTYFNEVQKNMEIPNSNDYVEHEFIRSITDSVIAATQAHDALLEMGYGITFVGGILSFMDTLRKELNLPDDVMPVVGLSVGKIAKENNLKPKINKVYINKYDRDTAVKRLEEYSAETKEYYANIGINMDFITQLQTVMAGKTYGDAFKSANKSILEFKKNIFKNK